MPTIATAMPAAVTALGVSPLASPTITGTTVPSEVTGATTPIVPVDSAR
jgi:hypothetical protein